MGQDYHPWFKRHVRSALKSGDVMLDCSLKAMISFDELDKLLCRLLFESLFHLINEILGTLDMLMLLT